MADVASEKPANVSMDRVALTNVRVEAKSGPCLGASYMGSMMAMLHVPWVTLSMMQAFSTAITEGRMFYRYRSTSHTVDMIVLGDN